MLSLFWLLVYFTGLAVTTGLGARTFYGIERKQSNKPMQAYQMAALEGAVCGLLWPIALPLLFVFVVGWIAVRISAPAEVRAEVARFNEAMTDRVLDFDRAVAERMQLALPAGCGTCTWAPDGSLILTPGCSTHDADDQVGRESRRRAASPYV